MERIVIYRDPIKSESTGEQLEADEDSYDLDRHGHPILSGTFANPPDPTDKYSTNPFHIDLTIEGLNNATENSKYDMIRIILENNTNYTFFDEDPGGPPSAIHGVGYGDDGDPLGMCGNTIRTINLANGSAQVAVFYIPTRGKTGKSPEGIFNIGLVPNPEGNGNPNPYGDTPIFIDPHAHQPG